VFTVTGASPGATCTATETVPAGYTGNQLDCVNVALGGSCTITNNVEVTLRCNAGLPLEQSLEINENSIVEFVVTSFGATEPDCDVTEVSPPGYSPTYTAGATTGIGLVSDDPEGCHFDDVVSGQFVCLIVNAPDLVDIEIEKLWVFDGTGGLRESTRGRYLLSTHLYCDVAADRPGRSPIRYSTLGQGTATVLLTRLQTARPPQGFAQVARFS
jgi:hypothetical protein